MNVTPCRENPCHRTQLGLYCVSVRWAPSHFHLYIVILCLSHCWTFFVRAGGGGKFCKDHYW